ncbi:MAG TPA: glycoside hydrolase [Ignavibacteria bacterium]|nr:glycoside hydrolase [Ignavibacteria bacterium]
MKLKSFILIFFIIPNLIFAQKSWIRINQLGYLQNSIKVAVLISKEKLNPNSFELRDAKTGNVLWKGTKIKSYGSWDGFKSTFRLYFSNFKKKGTYYLRFSNINSPTFRINNDVYNGTADFLLKYIREQQEGYNPFLRDSDFTHDGFVVDNPRNEGKYIDVKGGWADAGDHLKYVTTSATADYQLMFAYEMNPGMFTDKYDKNGDPGANGIPDILDEAKWGLNWLVKMNPDSGIMYNQVADDRDHTEFRLPDHDSVNYGYGKGLGRPVYFVTGKRQGIGKYKNRTTGVSSTAAKFASTFALGARLLKKYYPNFAKKIKIKAIQAYEFAKTDLGVTQTASYNSPYFYEESDYVDDLELAAVQLYKTLNDPEYLKEAVYWGSIEPVKPWMGADTARHYQWYPFINLGHYLLAESSDKNISKEFTRYLWQGLNRIKNKGKNNPFLIGIPFIWCSNNLVSAAITQANLYRKITNDTTFAEMEAALRDWLFGVNPWGTSFIIGLPKNGVYPSDPHSSIFLITHRQIDGGLVDGPVYGTIFKRLVGLKLYKPDKYSEFQSKYLVYHDDHGDYSTNEPTLDGTASLAYYLSAMQAEGKNIKKNRNGK